MSLFLRNYFKFFICFQGSDCTKKWTNIRDTYNKNKGKKLGTGSSAQQKVKRNEMMSFLDRTITSNKKYILLSFYFILLHIVTFFLFISNRTTTNIDLSDDEIEKEFESSDNNSAESSNDSVTSASKKRRTSSIDKMKIFENIAKDMKENQTKKLELFQQFSQPKNELELFFASICKTAEKFSPIEQAKLKVSVSRIVGEMEITSLENKHLFQTFSLENGESFTIENLPVTINDG